MQKNNTFNNRSMLISLLLLLSGMLQAQVLPGDADNNGGVENVDYLYIGYSYGQTGAIRLNGSTAPQEQSIQAVWSGYFPTGLNYAFSDANGDGIVNYLDLLTTAQNYGIRQFNYSPPIYFQDESGIPVNLDQRSIPSRVTQNDQLEVPILIGDDNSPAESFNGIAFTIEYDPVFVKNVTLDFSDSWLGDSTNLFTAISQPESGKIEVALTKFGNNPSYGKGIIGKLNFIVVDDLVAWLTTPNDSLETDIKITKVVYKGFEFSTHPTQTTDLSVMLYHPDALLASTPELSPETVSIIPNPSGDFTTIHCEFPIEEVALFDVSGRRIYTKRYNQKDITLQQLSDLESGVFFVKIKTRKGQIMKKLIIHH